MNNNYANLPDIRTLLQTFRQTGASMCKNAVKLQPNNSNDTFHSNPENGDDCTLASTTSSDHLQRLQNHGSEYEMESMMHKQATQPSKLENLTHVFIHLKVEESGVAGRPLELL